MGMGFLTVRGAYLIVLILMGAAASEGKEFRRLQISEVNPLKIDKNVFEKARVPRFLFEVQGVPFSLCLQIISGTI